MDRPEGVGRLLRVARELRIIAEKPAQVSMLATPVVNEILGVVENPGYTTHSQSLEVVCNSSDQTEINLKSIHGQIENLFHFLIKPNGGDRLKKIADEIKTLADEPNHM